jgi:hypothetical protein
MMEVGNDNNDQEYQRPRRPNAETISYLRGLPLNLAESNPQVSQFIERLRNEQNSSDETASEFPPIFFAAMMALIEVTNEVASLAADEQGSECLEVLAHICLPYSETCARIVLTALQGYHVFLATHRFGSHVLQTILQLVATLSDSTSKNDKSETLSMDLGLHAEAPPLTQLPHQLASLTDLISSIVEEIIPFTSALAVHVCGSHVLRSLLCLLGGVQLISSTPAHLGEGSATTTTTWERRGKQKGKKTKKKVDDDSASSHPTAIMVYLANSLQSSNAELFQEALARLTEALVTDAQDGKKKKASRHSQTTTTSVAVAPGHLQQLACHPSAGPLLVVLLRVLTYSDATVRDEWQGKFVLEATATDQQQQNQQRRLGIRRVEPTFPLHSPAHQLVQRLLCVVNDEPSTNVKENDDKDTSDQPKQPYAPDVIYGMAGEARGSHVLETIMCLSHDIVYASLLEWGDFTNPTALREYLEHAVSNFCIVTLLSTIRTAEQAGQMLKALDKVIASGYIVDPHKKRRAVLWRAVEMSAKFRVGQDSLLKAIRLGFVSLNEGGSEGAAESKLANEDPSSSSSSNKATKKKRRKASAIQLQDCIRSLLGLTGQEQPLRDNEDDEAPAANAGSSSYNNNKIQLDVLGTRTVYHLLQFAPRLSINVVDGILQNLTRHELELIAKDGLGSCCVMDGILDLALATSSDDRSIFSSSIQRLLTKLQGRWVELATDRVGHHSVIKLFHALDSIEDKQVLLTELVKSRSKLRGNAMGRKVMEVCAVQEFVDNQDVWKQTLDKRKKREEFLNEIVHDIIEKDDSKEHGKERKAV